MVAMGDINDPVAGAVPARSGECGVIGGGNGFPVKASGLIVH